MKDSYVKQYYNVPADIGRNVEYRGRVGVIYEDGGNYVAINFNDEKPGDVRSVHPTDPDLKYGEMGKIRNLTRSQKRYREYLRSDSGLSFSEWLGIKK